MGYMLEIHSACKCFGRGTVNEHKALEKVDLFLAPGDFVTVLGSNGAGKSTLFNAICGNFLLDSGQICLDGADITFMPEYKRSLKIGRLFQDPMRGTAPSLSIQENLALAYSKQKKRSFSLALTRKDREYFRQELARFDMGLEDRMETRVGLLSGGQRQALTLLMATLKQPKLLLLDEHTAALDPKTAKKVLELTEEIVEDQHLTALMVTHNMKDAIRIGNRLIMMHEGQIIYDVSGEAKKALHVSDLLQKFEEASGGGFANDRMMLAK